MKKIHYIITSNYYIQTYIFVFLIFIFCFKSVNLYSFKIHIFLLKVSSSSNQGFIVSPLKLIFFYYWGFNGLDWSFFLTLRDLNLFIRNRQTEHNGNKFSRSYFQHSFLLFLLKTGGLSLQVLFNSIRKLFFFRFHKRWWIVANKNKKPTLHFTSGSKWWGGMLGQRDIDSSEIESHWKKLRGCWKRTRRNGSCRWSRSQNEEEWWCSRA